MCPRCPRAARHRCVNSQCLRCCVCCHFNNTAYIIVLYRGEDTLYALSIMMKPPVRFLNENAIVLRAEMSAHRTKERLHGGPVDVFPPRGKVDQGMSSKVSVAGFTASSKDSQNTRVALKHAPGRPRPMDGPSARAAALRNVLLPPPPSDVR